MVKYYKQETIKGYNGKDYKTLDEITRKAFFDAYDLFRGESGVETYVDGDARGLIAALNDNVKIHYFMIYI
jgi:hypothetical protein